MSAGEPWTEDAGAATPRVLEALRNQGVDVASSSELRPSFDEVFGELVARKQRERAQSEVAAAQTPPEPLKSA